MNVVEVLGRAARLSVSAWLETLVLAIFLSPVLWGVFEVVQSGADSELLNAIFAIPQVLFTGFSAAVLFQAFDNTTRGTDVELPIAKLGKLSFSIAAATFIANALSSVGYMFCFIPGVVISVGLFLTQVLLFKEDRGILDAVFESWARTRGNRLEIFFVLVATGVIAVVALTVVLFAGFASLFADVSAEKVGLVQKVIFAVSAGGMGACWLTFSRGLEYAIYEELSAQAVPVRPLRHDDPIFHEPLPPESASEAEAAPQRPKPEFRPPITVDQDIVFGQDADDDKDGW